jgi:hypothetical protein
MTAPSAFLSIGPPGVSEQAPVGRRGKNSPRPLARLVAWESTDRFVFFSNPSPTEADKPTQGATIRHEPGQRRKKPTGPTTPPGWGGAGPPSSWLGTVCSQAAAKRGLPLGRPLRQEPLSRSRSCPARAPSAASPEMASACRSAACKNWHEWSCGVWISCKSRPQGPPGNSAAYSGNDGPFIASTSVTMER